jgi:copper chaperone CopZ
MKREQVAFDVPDMKCSGCVERMQSVLARLDGVQSASTDLEEKTATVRHDADRTSPDAILDAIETAGYSPTHS